MTRTNIARQRTLLLAGVLSALLLTGCGDPGLWARYRAERASWQARREVARILVAPRVASEADYRRAVAAHRVVLDAFPASRWATPERLAQDPYAGTIARIAGRSAVMLGWLADAEGRSDEALARYAAAIDSFAAVRSVALDAMEARASSLDRQRRTVAAGEAWAALVDAMSPADLDDVRLDRVLVAGRMAAERLRAAGRDADAGAVLAREAGWLSSAIAEQPGEDTRVELLDALARNRLAAGATAEALAAWRELLAMSIPTTRRAGVLLEMAERAIATGWPDSALAFSNRARLAAEEAEDPGLMADAQLTAADAWARAGHADTALTRFGDVIDQYPREEHAVARARFARAELLERMGAWERARSEYRTLTAATPTHPLALSALGRIVEYHARRGETSLARFEGRRAVETLDRMIEAQRGADVQFDVRRVRANILLTMDANETALEALEDFWRRYPDRAEGAESGLRAAALAEELGDHDRARGLLESVAADAADPASRARAQNALATSSKEIR